ncbi:hypothetical protein CTI12_AA023830 [Artemisia annua]|uniref:Uncharacterized protein n=1 Tax=Artemisia annua TaxID=35608 RepID=A0A2U1QJ92_ARTAN|nr:hypothetical protein CTI12_AA023830 [Artemisia annua]
MAPWQYLPTVTLTTIAVSIPDEGLKYIREIEKHIDEKNDLKHVRKAAEVVWSGVELYNKCMSRKCHESRIEEREKSIRSAVLLFAKTKKILEVLDSKLPEDSDHGELIRIDKWHLVSKKMDLFYSMSSSTDEETARSSPSDSEHYNRLNFYSKGMKPQLMPVTVDKKHYQNQNKHKDYRVYCITPKAVKTTCRNRHITYKLQPKWNYAHSQPSKHKWNDAQHKNSPVFAPPSKKDDS